MNVNSISLGGFVINWVEDGFLQTMKFDTVSAAKSFYRELKKKGLKIDGTNHWSNIK